MAVTEVRLAKLSRPRVGDALARERLFSRLDRVRDSPVAWIAAQPGAGKTTLMASYIKARKLRCLWYEVDAADGDPASFFYHLGIAATELKRRGSAAPLPALAPEHRRDLPAFARHYFRELYGRMGVGSALVLDNLHEVARGADLHRVLAAALDELPEGVAVLVASRQEPPEPYVPLIARDRVVFVDDEEMRLTLEETADIVQRRADLDERAVRALHARSEGWAAGVTLLVERARRGEPIDTRHDPGALTQVFAYFAEQLLAHDFRGEIDHLMQLALLPRVTPELAAGLTGDPKAAALLESLHRRHLFTQRRSLGARYSYELHALLRAYLQHKAREAWTAERRREVVARAAGLLEEAGEREAAIAFHRELEDWEGAARCILGAATDLIAQGRRNTLIEWIASLPEEIRDRHPRLRYWHASALAPHDARAAREEYERAHAGFARGGDALGRLMCASGIIYTHYLDITHLKRMDPLIAEINAAIDAGMKFPTPSTELHVQGALLFGLCFRRPEADRVRACGERLFRLMDDPRIGAHEKVSAAGLLLFHCYHHANLDDAYRLVALIEPIIATGNLTPAVRGLWWNQVGFLEVTAGDLPAASRAFETAIEVCSRDGLSIPLVDVYAQFGLAFVALMDADVARADAQRLKAEAHWKTFRRVDVAAGALIKGVLASRRGDFAGAAEHAREHHEVSEEAGIQWQTHNALLHRAYVAAECRRPDEAFDYTRQARSLVKGTVFERFHYQSDLIDAYAHLLAGDLEAMRAPLATGLAKGATDRAKFFLRLQPHMLPRLLAAALEEGIEVDNVRRTIRELRIAPPSFDVKDWPWALTVRTLGRFEVRRDGQPLEFSRKAPRKTLQLLKAIVAAGGSQVPDQTLIDALWGEEEGDAAAKSLGAAVIRLRALLGDADAVVQQAGTLSLDRSRVWIDALAFDATGDLALYGGSFLAEEEGSPWPVPMREKLRARFIQRVAETGAALEREGRCEEAIAHYNRGLDADSIVEPFYQGLMRCYHRLDRFAEAASAYRRLKQILSVTLGVPPSATTERLYRSLHLPAPNPESVGNK